jgi:type II secretory pathway pseudopilin PulG
VKPPIIYNWDFPNEKNRVTYCYRIATQIACPSKKRFMTAKLRSELSRRSGLSLIEVVVSMFVLTLLALATTQALIFSKYTAEESLYEATALNLGLSIIEQMKSASYQTLENPPQKKGGDSFTMLVENGVEEVLLLGEENQLKVPIVTEAGGTKRKLLPTTVIPTIREMSDGNGLWLEVRYSFEHPRSGVVRESVVRNAITNIRSI